MARIAARSVSRQVVKWVGDGPTAGRVLAVHRRACNLVIGQGDVIALVAPEVGDGPLNLVLGTWADCLSDLQPGDGVTCRPDQLVLNGRLEIGLAVADIWEPRPDWEALRARRSAIELSLSSLATLCLGYDPDNVLWSLLGGPSLLQGIAAILAQQFREAAGQLGAGWGGDEHALVQGGASLAGLGDGLTPAGDDFLVGVMLWAWLAHPAPQRFCSTLAEAAAPRTTTLSAAFLRAAARGQCSASWHGLLAALVEGRSAAISGAARAVLSRGASSGMDALIGFLYLSWDEEDACRTSM